MQKRSVSPLALPNLQELFGRLMFPFSRSQLNLQIFATHMSPRWGLEGERFDVSTHIPPRWGFRSLMCVCLSGKFRTRSEHQITRLAHHMKRNQTLFKSFSRHQFSTQIQNNQKALRSINPKSRQSTSQSNIHSAYCAHFIYSA